MKKTLYLAILAGITTICIIVGSIYHISGWFGMGWFGGNGIIENIFSFVDDNDSERDRSKVTYSDDLEEFDKIDIDTSVMDITINTGNSYHIEYNCKAYLKPDISVKGKTFTLYQPSVKWWGRNNKCSMTLTVPSGAVLDNMDISSDVGDIKIYNTGSENISVDADVGNITLESCVFESSDIEGDVGNVKINSSNLGNSNIETDTGNINIDSCEFKDIDIYDDVGNITLNTNVDLTNYEIDLSTDMGSIKYKGEKQKKYYHQSASGTSTHYNINIETDIGNIIFN